MNYLMKHFDYENGLLNEAFNDYRKPLEILTGIFDNHGHSGFSASFVINHLKRYRDLRYKEVGLEEATPFKIDVNFKDLFDQLDAWYFGNEERKGVDIGINGIQPIVIDDESPLIDFFVLLDTFIQVAEQDPISPLTGEDWEWNQVGSDIYQNKRMSSVFKNTETNEVYWLEGNAALEFSKDYSYRSGYTGGDIPDYTVSFPFDPTQHERIYYVRKHGSRENLLIGTYDEIKDQVDAMQREGRRTWMLGFEDGTQKLRKELLISMSYSQASAAYVHFKSHIKPLLNEEDFDLYNLTEAQTTLFEGSALIPIPATIQAMLYRCAVLYSEIDREVRQRLFNLELVLGVYLKPSQHYQKFEPYENEFNSTWGGKPFLGEVCFLDEDRQRLEETVARKYLYNQCKEKGLEFKPGKTGSINDKPTITPNTQYAFYLEPRVVDPKRERVMIHDYHQIARDYGRRQ